MPGSDFERRVRAHLRKLEARGLGRTLRPPSGIDLSSNDYLALSGDPRIVSSFIEGASREGCGSTGSRLLRGEREAFADVERRFARFKGTDRSLYFSTGYMANIAVLATLSESDDVIFSDAANHASLIDGSRLARARHVVFPHNDDAALAALLEATPCRGVRFVVVESLFSMDGDFAPLSEYAALCRDSGAVLIVDEAHAVGVWGAQGTGLIEEAGVQSNVCVSINTAGKALGVAGAFVAGPDWLIEYLVQRARPFVFSTAPPPALADALEASLTIVSDEPERRVRLHRLGHHLRQRLAAAGLLTVTEIRPRFSGRLAEAETASQLVPLHVGDSRRAVALAERLQALGFDVRAIRPPTVPIGTARLRISVNVNLTEDLLDRFVDALVPAYQEVGVCSVGSS
jgi:8-amino-7-oxononanoate synthase